MSSSSYDEVEARLEQMLGPIEGDDPRVRRRLHILRTATDLFVQQGYRKTTMGEVAKAAGVAKGTVYTYFASKIDLLMVAIMLEKRESLSMMADALDDRLPAVERLRSYVIALMVMPSRMPITAALFRGDEELAAVMAEIPPEVMAENIDYREQLLGTIVDEAAGHHRWTPSEIRDRLQVISGLSILSVHLENPALRGGLSIERYAEIMADLIVGGLQVPKGNER